MMKENNVGKRLLEVSGLKTHFYTEEGIVPAVDGLTFGLDEGETLAIVGESGCGKSVSALSILRLVAMPPGRIVDGEVLYGGKDLLRLTDREMRSIRGNEISMIFQEPMTSLNPVLTIGRQIAEPLLLHHAMSRAQARARGVELLEMVGISSPDRAMDSYPHEFSGGMRQRAMIAMAIACGPKILIADEPTTALDVTIQAQIMRLLQDLKQKSGMAMILITHDMGIVAQIAQNVLVMYAGQAVEYADVRSIFDRPMHPYTAGLLRSIPKLHQKTDLLYSIEGAVPGLADLPAGCRFSTRCALADDRCRAQEPPFCEAEGRMVRCFRCGEGGERLGSGAACRTGPEGAIRPEETGV